MLTAFICVASLLQSNVSIEIKAERLERAAPALAKAFGMENLAVSPTLKDDVLAFRCKDVRLDEAKSKIETVLNASFIRKEGGWSLEQSDVQRAQDNQKEATAAHVRYSKLVESCQKQLASMGPFDAKAAAKLQSDLKLLSSQEVSYNDDLYYTRLLKVGLQGPLSRFGMRLIGRLKAKDWMPLTRLRPKIVYSLTPTRTQLPMPFPVRDLIDQLNQEQNLWSDLYGNAKLEGPRIREQDGTLTESSTLGEANELRSRYSPDSFAAITCTLNWDEDSVTIFTYDKKGFQSSATSLSIDTIEPLPATKSDLDLDATPFKHTEEMNTFNAAFFGDRSRSITDQPNAALTEKLLNPIEIDPLSISAYPQLAHSAKSKNFVAILDDMYLGERALTFKKIAEDKAGLDVNESADWIEVIHKNPIGRRLDQADRRTASRIFKMIASRKSDLSIEERADFIASQPVMRENDNYIHQIGTLLGRAGIRVFRNPAGHRVYGTLTES
ncbi:MAG TPA: hypothetical protein VK171_06295, partial [Fimbriimonas sp.]|nr:hypothetical protein [Fimbriimonas sp.]